MKKFFIYIFVVLLAVVSTVSVFACEENECGVENDPIFKHEIVQKTIPSGPKQVARTVSYPDINSLLMMMNNFDNIWNLPHTRYQIHPQRQYTFVFPTEENFAVEMNDIEEEKDIEENNILIDNYDKILSMISSLRDIDGGNKCFF